MSESENLFQSTKGIVIDPFVGSGTTAVAAERPNRHYIGIDFEWRNVVIARDRLEGVRPG